MRLFDFSLRLNGFKIHEARAFLSSIQKKNASEYEQFLKTQKEEIISYHLKNNTFYKSLGKNVKSKRLAIHSNTYKT